MPINADLKHKNLTDVILCCLLYFDNDRKTPEAI